MKTKEEILSLVSEILENYRENEWNRKNNESYQSDQGLIEAEAEKIEALFASHLSERVKELDELISENLAGKTNIECPHCNGDVQVYNDDVHLVMCSKNEEIDKLQARIKELESQQQPVKEVERQHDTFCKCANYTNTDTSGQWCSKCGGQIPLAAQIKYPYF